MSDTYLNFMSHLKDKNPRDYDGRTPLYLAAQNGHLEVCRLIIENIEDPELKNPHNNYGRTPLDAAASSGHREIVKLIVSNIETDWNKRNFNTR